MKAPRRPIILTVLAAVLLVAAGSATAQYSFEWTFERQGAVPELVQTNPQIWELVDFLTEFTNTSAVVDSFRCTLVKDMPLSWQATICEGPICYPPNYTVHTFELGPGEATTLDFAITAVVEQGKGTSTVTLESLNDPAVTETHSFSIITSGLDILTVDGDGGAAHETYYLDAIAGAGRTTADWTRSYMGPLTAADLAGFTGVVWYVGDNSADLDLETRTALKDYVFNDGNLYLAGQNLARDFCDPGSPLYSPESRAWFQDLLGVDYQADDAGTSAVVGVAGDPVGDGQAFDINGGDGADNNDSPDEILALSNAISLTYATGATAGLRGAYGDGRTYFTGFGFEGISSGLARTNLMTAVLDWITNPFTAVGDQVVRPLISRPFVTPNPFNPQTSLKFEVGGSQAVPADVVIYDLRGRAVRNLYSGTVEPGLRTLVWNGRDDGGRSLSSGIYLAQVKVADQTRAVKMTLAR
jgi:hypothetical protein